MTIFSTLVALAFGKFLAVAVPFRARPMHNALLGFHVPYTLDPTGLDGWSSFPSDHAVLIFALATGLMTVSRSIGVVALIHAVFVVCLPRVYLGLHYPTDLIAGMLIGIGTASLMHNSGVVQRFSSVGVKWEQKYTPLFYPCLFLMTYQIAVLLDDARQIGKLSFDMLKGISQTFH